MVASEISMTEVQLKSFVDSKRPKDKEILKLVDVGYSWDGRDAILFEVRPKWDDPEVKLELPFAKITFVKSKALWKLYWMRASGKWELYEPHAQDGKLNTLLNVIKKDAHACFFG